MSEYLSKEEIKQWRSSLEKITLEEFAARLGKKLEQDKPTNDLVDIVLKGQPVISKEEDWNITRGERISSIAERAYDREREIAPSPFSAHNLKAEIAQAAPAKKTTAKKAVVAKAEKAPKIEPKKDLREEVRIVFKKALTDREQKVFDYFAQNSNKIVYAKDLAALLDLPRDYVYKYIKNLRAKIEGDNLKNADKGGFVLSI
ncbi:MAG: helix-turn-helix domain-containing protein [Cyanobacteria bacterium SIG32]|nr:helix-turn-helix domain-containing protein [Cyanobacteria bacterium SIG32]